MNREDPPPVDFASFLAIAFLVGLAAVAFMELLALFSAEPLPW